MSSLRDRRAALGPTQSWFYFFVSPFAFGRAVILTLGEAGKELWQARRQRVDGIEPRIHRGGELPDPPRRDQRAAAPDHERR